LVFVAPPLSTQH